MTNTFVDPNKIAKEYKDLLEENLVLANTIKVQELRTSITTCLKEIHELSPKSLNDVVAEVVALILKQ